MYGPASALNYYQKGNNLCLRACNPSRIMKWMNETLIKMKLQSIEYLMNLFISPNWRSSAYNSFNHSIRQGVDRNYTILYYEMATVECVLWSIIELMEQVFRYPTSVLWNKTYKQAWFQSYSSLICQPSILCCHQYHCWIFCFVLSLISPYVLLCLLKYDMLRHSGILA